MFLRVFSLIDIYLDFTYVYLMRQLDGNISDSGAGYIAAVLRTSDNISSFYLDGENITGNGLLSIACGINGKPAIQSMNICNYLLSIDAAKCNKQDIDRAVAAIGLNMSSLRICIGIFVTI